MKIGNEFDSDILFDGENNIIKRNTTFTNLKKGGKTLNIKVPHNCYFYGVIIRKVIKFVGDNYYGDSLGNEVGNMVLTSCTVTNSDNVKPTELSATVFYDDAFECNESPSGFYIDYHDECNFYVKNDNNEITQIFGGYVSSILPDGDRTKLTIACADRLIDGQNKYVLDKMTIGGGKADPKSDEYADSMSKDFDGYAQALKYLCDIHETTLGSSISNQYTVDGETFHDGFTVTFGSSKKIKKIKATNGTTKVGKNYIMLRNNPDSRKQQSWMLYDASENAKKPIEITQYPYLHITYGLSEPKTSWSSKTTEKVDVADTTAGSQVFNKCGQSPDGKYVIGIGQPSAGRHEGHSYSVIWKTVFENRCPWCGGKLVWDYARQGADCVHCGGYSHSKREWGAIPETEITCSKCCADYCAVTGWDKNGHFSKKLKTISKPVKSSKSEQWKLANGKLSAVAESGQEVSSDDIFKAITKLAFKYRYNLSTGASSYAEMKRTGVGECWAFSDLIFTELKRYGVSCRIKNYGTSMSYNHRSVQYKNTSGNWVNFPYREYGWGTKYNNMLNDTGGVWNGRTVAEYKGSNIGSVKSKKNTTKTQTTNVTHTKGYDKDKPFQGYLRITYSLEQSFKAKKYTLDVKFTRNSSSSKALNGVKTYWVNNTIKKTTLRLENNKTLMDFFRTLHGEDCRIFLQSIQMIAPKIPLKKKDDGNYEDTSWYKSDDSTDDQSSCKFNLHQITFNDNRGADEDDFNSCGKTVNAMIKDIVDKAGYYVSMDYGTHRKDDKIHFRVVTDTSEKYTASEGESNNILSWSSISYSPVSSLYNMSIQVFKKSNGEYKYVDTRDGKSILNYGEQTILQTNNGVGELSEKEAYFNAMYNNKYNPSQEYSYTITVPNCPKLNIGDYVKVVANSQKLNRDRDRKSVVRARV